MHKYRLLLGLVLSVGLCSASPVASFTILARADAAWARRDEIDALKRAIELYAKVARLALPQSQQILVRERIARGYYLLADAFLHKEPKQQLRFFGIAVGVAESCLALDTWFRTHRSVPRTAVRQLSKPFTGCLLVAAAAEGRRAQIKGIFSSLASRPKIEAYIGRAYQLDPTYLAGAADRFYGVYYAVLPSFLGGSLKKSEAHFQRALEIAPDYLGTKVLMAQELATRQNDPQRFTRLLYEVLAADPNTSREWAPENHLEQRKARRLLQKRAEMFAACPLFDEQVLWHSTSTNLPHWLTFGHTHNPSRSNPAQPNRLHNSEQISPYQPNRTT